MKNDFSDRDILFKHSCEACLPDAEHKKKLWNAYVEGTDFN